MLKILLVDELQERAAEICAALVTAGHQVAAVLSSTNDLAAVVLRIQPDVILIETAAPARDTLEHVASMNRDAPRPVVMLARNVEKETIRKAIQAGVAAYVADGIDLSRLRPVIDVAIARFEAHEHLRKSLYEANRKLSGRKVLDQAKQILMKTRQIDEPAAHAALRKLAMDRGKTIEAVAQDVIDMAKLLL